MSQRPRPNGRTSSSGQLTTNFWNTPLSQKINDERERERPREREKEKDKDRRKEIPKTLAVVGSDGFWTQSFDTSNNAKTIKKPKSRSSETNSKSSETDSNGKTYRKSKPKLVGSESEGSIGPDTDQRQENPKIKEEQVQEDQEEFDIDQESPPEKKDLLVIKTVLDQLIRQITKDCDQRQLTPKKISKYTRSLNQISLQFDRFRIDERAEIHVNILNESVEMAIQELSPTLTTSPTALGLLLRGLQRFILAFPQIQRELGSLLSPRFFTSAEPSSTQQQPQQEEIKLSTFQNHIQSIIKIQRWYRRRSSQQADNTLSGRFSEIMMDVLTSDDQELVRGRRRIKAVEELIKTEEDYVVSLKSMCYFYRNPLIEEIKAKKIKSITLKEASSIFIYVEMIHSVNTRLLQQMKQRRSEWPKKEKFFDIFKKNIPELGVYMAYVGNYNEAITILQKASAHEDFSSFMEAQSSKYNTKNLASLLIQPIQRLPRYELLLRDIRGLTPEAHVDYQDLVESLEKIKSLVTHINRKKLEQEQRSLHTLIFQIHAFPKNVLGPSIFLARQSTSVQVVPDPKNGKLSTIRQSTAGLVRSSTMREKKKSSPHPGDKKKEMWVLLFNEFLLLAKPHFFHGYRYYDTIDLRNLSVQKLEELPRSFSVESWGQGRSRSWTFTVDEDDSVDDWVAKIRELLDILQSQDKRRSTVTRSSSLSHG